MTTNPDIFLGRKKMKNNTWKKGLVLGIIILFVGACFTPTIVIRGQPPAEEWNKTYGEINSDEIGEWVEQTNDGGYIIAGRTGSSGLYDAWLIKTNDKGDIVWNKVYHGSGNAWVEYVQQTTDGGYIAAGTISGYDGWLIKTDADGNMTWDRVFDDVLNEGPIHRAWQTADGGYILVGTAHGKVWLCKTDTNGYVTWSKTFSDWGGHGYSVQQTNDGGYILVGLAYLSGGGEDARLVKTDANGNTIWSKYYGGSNSDAGHSVRQTAEGGYIIGGVTTSYGSGTQDVWLIKTDSSGKELWNNTYGGSDNSWCHTVQLTNDGGYILSGSCNYQYKVSCDFCLIKTDASGNEEWNKTFGGTGLDIGRAVQQIADGGYILVGETTSFGAGSKDVWLIKVARENQPPESEWSKTYGGSDRDYGFSAQQTSDGGYIITGSTYSYGNGLRDVWLIKTDSNGNEEWNRTFGGANNDIGHYVQQTIDGGYIITGYTESYGPLYANVWLIKTDSNGSEEWNRTFGSYRVEIGYSVQQTADGGFIITGSYQEGWTGTNVWLIKTDSNGTTVWSRGFGDRDTGDVGHCVQQTDDGGYVIVGHKRGDVWLIKTDSNGNWMWDETFGGRYSDVGYSVQQTIDGGYIVAGTLVYKNTYGNYDIDVWLIKTNSSGGEEWSKTFGGRYTDYGFSVQQTLDGGYVITGSTLSSGSGAYDVWLIKTDTDGTEEWNITIGGTSSEVGRSVQQTNDGGYIITGHTYSYGSGLSDVCLIKVAGENQPPDPPNLISPGTPSESGDIVNILTPTFQWNSVQGADHYALYISESPYGSEHIVYDSEKEYGPIYGTTFDSLPDDILNDGEKYRWNMRAYNNAGWSIFSSYLYFEVNLLPECNIVLKKDGREIEDIIIGDTFDICVTDYSDDITEVRFLSDENQNEKVDDGFSWTIPYDWGISLEDWNAETKTMKWSFTTGGPKEIWVEVNDSADQTDYCFADIYADVDSDGDGLTDREEIKYETNPKNKDTDGDGLSDWDEVSLALSYKPILKLAKGELFRPTQVNNFLDYAKLKKKEGGFTSIGPPLNSKWLKLYRSEDYYLDLFFDYWTNAENYNDVFDIWSQVLLNNDHTHTTYVNVLKGKVNIPVMGMYSQSTHTGDHQTVEYIAIQYWFNYIYNRCMSIKGSPGLDDHEGDWEHITLFLTKQMEPEPFWIVYSRHAKSYGFQWFDKENSPVVFVAKGSHASYPNSKVDYWNNTIAELIDDHQGDGPELDKNLHLLMIQRQPWIFFEGIWGVEHSTPFAGKPLLGGHKYFQNPGKELKDSGYTVVYTFSPVNLHALDEFGRHVGINETGDIEVEIPEAEYSGPDAHPQWIRIFNNSLNVTFYTTGIETGTFDMIYERVESLYSEVYNFTNISTTASTIAYLNSTQPNVLEIDENGDGIVDSVLSSPVVNFTYHPSFVVVNKTITFNGSSSYDSDGYIVSYEWDFGDGNTSMDIVTNHTYSNPGIYFVTLKIIDNDDLTNMIQKIIVVSSTLQATPDIDPDTLNLNSTGKWVTCYIEFPEGYNVPDINISTILLNETVPAEDHPTNISDYDEDGIPDLMVKFDRQDVIDILELGDNVAITVAGKLFDETQFEGTDHIKVI